MYRYVDRPLTALDSGAAPILRAMRQWVAALAARTRPPGAVGPGLNAASALPALPCLRMALMPLNENARNPVAFAPAGCMHIADKAVLARVIETIGWGVSAVHDRATPAMIVFDEAAAPLSVALEWLAGSLVDAGRSIGISARHGPVHE